MQGGRRRAYSDSYPTEEKFGSSPEARRWLPVADRFSVSVFLSVCIRSLCERAMYRCTGRACLPAARCLCTHVGRT